MLRSLLPAVGLLCLLFSPGFSQALPDSGVITAVRVGTPPALDGFLGDEAWKGASPATRFTQRELQEGSEASERTEVRMVFDDDALYIGLWCYDSAPGEIIANEMKRDFSYGAEDDVELILDTYRDKRNGFLFIINPNGARYDALVTDEGGGINADWNGLWDARTSITSEGWFAEIKIPFSTLRFPDDETMLWGINFARNIRRKREQVLWQAYLRNYGLVKLSRAGTLAGLSAVHRGSAVEVKPYLLGGVQREYPPLADTRSTQTKMGLDLKYSLTPTLTLDVTTNTDFAQVEADRQRINLTRFPLFFPEKRDFFLEGAGIFDFQFGDAPRPFYSRRIGITAGGELLPILGGIRLVGKAGQYNLGLLTMQTGESAGEPTTNFAVARVKRDVLEQSYIGVLATNKQSSSTYNRLLGADAAWVTSNVFGNNTLVAGGALAGTTSPGTSSHNLAYRVYVDYPNDFIDHFVGIRSVQRNFDPQVGFVDRTDFRQYSWEFKIRPRPRGIGMQYLEFKPGELDYFVNPDGSLQSMWYEGRLLGFCSNSGEVFEWNIQRIADRPTQDFEIFPAVAIPAARYWWTRWELQLETNSSRPLSCAVLYSWGDFYNGKRQEFMVEPKLIFGGHLALSAEYAQNRIQLPGGSFRTDELAASLDYGFSTMLDGSIFAQWNNEDKVINVNFRLHWIPEIGSDVYLVYNHLFDNLDRIRTTRATLLLKAAYLIVL